MTAIPFEVSSGAWNDSGHQEARCDLSGTGRLFHPVTLHDAGHDVIEIVRRRQIAATEVPICVGSELLRPGSHRALEDAERGLQR